MKVQITATAPTVYQLNILRAFNLDYNKGSFFPKTETMQFDTVTAARAYLEERAIMYNDSDPEGNPKRLASMRADIRHNALTLDAVTAYIERIK